MTRDDLQLQSKSTQKEVKVLAEQLRSGVKQLEAGWTFENGVILSLLATVIAKHSIAINTYLSNNGVEKFLAVCPPGTIMRGVGANIQVGAGRQISCQFQDHQEIDLEFPVTVLLGAQSDPRENWPIREFFIRKTRRKFSTKIFWKNVAKQMLDGETLEICVQQAADDIWDEIFTEANKYLERYLRELGLLLFNDPEKLNKLPDSQKDVLRKMYEESKGNLTDDIWDEIFTKTNKYLERYLRELGLLLFNDLDQWNKLPDSQKDVLSKVYEESKGNLTAEVKWTTKHSRAATKLIKLGLIERSSKGKYCLTPQGKEITELSRSRSC